MSVDLNDPERLRAVGRLSGTAFDAHESLDRVARLTSRLLDATAQVSLLSDRQVIVSAAGAMAPVAGAEFAFSESLCACVVARAGPFMINDLNADPDLREYPAVTGGLLRSYLAVPMISSDGYVIGTLAVYSGEPRTWVEADRENLHDLAASVATEIEHRAKARDLEAAYAERDLAALTLQRSLLPAALPDLAELVCAARYQPGTTSGVGGDWYDVVDLGAGRSMIVLGDVMGRGLRAAAFMGQLRAAARSYARLDLSPAEVLKQLDDVVADETATGDSETMIATCVVAVHEPAEGRVRLASAGHPAPLLVSAGECRQVALTPGPILGVGGGSYVEHEIDVAEGDVLAFFTDGLVERRGQDYDEGIDTLSLALSGVLSHAPVTRDALEEAAGKAIAFGSDDDDVALLLVAPADRSAAHEGWFAVAADDIGTSAARSRVRGQLRHLDLDTVDTIELLASEMIGNSLRHGDGETRVRMRVRDQRVFVEVGDESDRVPSRRIASMRDETGRGLELLGALARRWGWRTTERGKIVWAEVVIGGSRH